MPTEADSVGASNDNSLHELSETLKSIRNRCEISITLINFGYCQEHLATLLEDIFIDAQTILDGYCKEE